MHLVTQDGKHSLVISPIPLRSISPCAPTVLVDDVHQELRRERIDVRPWINGAYPRASLVARTNIFSWEPRPDELTQRVPASRILSEAFLLPRGNSQRWFNDWMGEVPLMRAWRPLEASVLVALMPHLSCPTDGRQRANGICVGCHEEAS